MRTLLIRIIALSLSLSPGYSIANTEKAQDTRNSNWRILDLDKGKIQIEIPKDWYWRAGHSEKEEVFCYSFSPEKIENLEEITQGVQIRILEEVTTSKDEYYKNLLENLKKLESKGLLSTKSLKQFNSRELRGIEFVIQKDRKNLYNLVISIDNRDIVIVTISKELKSFNKFMEVFGNKFKQTLIIKGLKIKEHIK